MKTRYYITTPIYYVNGAPHIGHAYTSIAADVMARWKRLQGIDVFFLTGTDEHGQKVEKAAREAGIDPQSFTNKVSADFRDMALKMGVSFDDYIRTTEERHRVSCAELWKRIDASGNIWVTTGNGSSSTPYDFSDSVLELSPALARTQYFAPDTWQNDNSHDLDLGSSSPALLSNGTLLQVGKSSTAYLVNQSDLGGISHPTQAAVCSSTADGGDAVLGTVVYVPCSSGVEAASTARMMDSSNPIGGPALRHDETDAVEHEGIAGEHVKQQQALEHLGEIERHLEGDLRALPADEGEREEQRGEQDADRVQPPEERNDDGGEAVAGRERRLQVPHRAGDFDHAGEAGEGARYDEGR